MPGAEWLKVNPRRLILYAMYTVVLFGANFGVLRALADLASRNPTSSHTVIVPLVTLALIYRDRAAIFSSCRPAWWGGLSVIMFGLCLVVAGRALSGPLSQLDPLSLAVAGVVIAWFGGFLVFFGADSARAALFPWVFCCFTVPIPTELLDIVTGLLKRGSAATLAWFFALTGTPFHRTGFVFSLPTVVIEVADECSGIRSSIALLLTGLLAGQASLRSPLAKVILILAIFPLSVLKNGIRIASLTLLAIHVSPSFLVGRLHNEGGIVFFLMSLALLAPVLLILRRLDRQSAPVPLS